MCGVVLYKLRISEVKMQKTNDNQPVMNAHRKVKASTTLNRKYVRRPERNIDNVAVSVKRSAKVKRFDIGTTPMAEKQQTAEQQMAAATVHPLQQAANAKMKQRQNQAMQAQVKKMTAKELKDQAISKALAEAARPAKDTTKTKKNKIHFGFPRIALALSCAAAVVLVIVYFVNLNMPDISLKVAAMQTGFEASYPSYVPREYTLSGITSEEGNITLNFRNHAEDTTFSLNEEKSTWDSGALLNNYVRPTYGENYSTVKEQGLTIYINGSNATWVNGGIVYKLTAESSNLTKKQVKSIAVSL